MGIVTIVIIVTNIIVMGFFRLWVSSLHRHCIVTGKGQSPVLCGRNDDSDDSDDTPYS